MKAGVDVVWRVLSPRVRWTALAIGVLVLFIEIFEPEPVKPTVLLPAFSQAVSELEVVAGPDRAIYAPAKEHFALIGPPAAVDEERRRGERADNRAKSEPTFTGLVGDRVPSVWRAQRLSAMAVSCLSALRGGRVVAISEPHGADRAATGLERPEVVVRVRAGTEYEVRIGAASPSNGARYFHCPQIGMWGLIGADLVARLKRLAARSLPEE